MLFQSVLKKTCCVLISLVAIKNVSSQKAIEGFSFLGSHKEHHYYISHQFYFGKDIKLAVADAKSKLSLPSRQVYATAIVNMEENLFIQNAVIAYNILTYGGNGKSSFENWHDPRNPWIGLTDSRKEKKFNWSNKQANCENFTNWNSGEPNNFGTNEDYTQMLIMNPYQVDEKSQNDPVGKWNDWFNQYISNDKKKETKLPVVIEVGEPDCK